MKNNRTNILGCIACLLLASVLFVLIYTTNKHEEAKAASLVNLYEKVEPYEAELQELEIELMNVPQSATYSSDSSEFMIGFLISDMLDLTYIEDKADLYGFQPVIVLDCTMDMDTIEAIISGMEESYEIMLYATDLSDDNNKDVVSVISYLESIDREYSRVFFLRDDDYNASNIRLLKKDGFYGYTLYKDDSPEAGQAYDDTIYIDYAYLTSSRTSVLDRLSESYENNASTIIIFDIDSIESGAISETYITAVLNTLYDYTKDDNCSFATLKEVVEKLSNINNVESKKAAEYEKQRKQLQKQIDELKYIIDDIYSGIEN